MKDLLIKAEALHDFIEERSEKGSICLIDKDIILQGIRNLYVAANRIIVDDNFDSDIDDDIIGDDVNDDFDNGGVIIYDSHADENDSDSTETDSDSTETDEPSDKTSDIRSDHSKVEPKVEFEICSTSISDSQDDSTADVETYDELNAQLDAKSDIDTYEDTERYEEPSINCNVSSYTDDKDNTKDVTEKETAPEPEADLAPTTQADIIEMPVGLELAISPILKEEIVEQLCGGDHELYSILMSELNEIDDSDMAMLYIHENFAKAQNCSATAELANIIDEKFNK